MKPSLVLRELSLVVRRHRAVLAALLTAAAVVTALPLLVPAPAATRSVVAAAHDLTAGQSLTKDDLVTVALPAAVVPDGALTALDAAVGQVLSGPVRRGQPLTDVQLLGSGLLSGPGLVEVPVRLADSASLALLHAGDRVDVLAAPTSSQQAVSSAVTVASGVRVLAVPGQQDSDGGLIVIAASPATAARLAAAAVGSRLSVTVLAR